MITRTREEINAEIAALDRIKPRVPERSFFGDDNWGKIEIEIDVLEAQDDISDNYEGDLYHVAYDAFCWLEGQDVDLGDGKMGSMSDSWAGIAK